VRVTAAVLSAVIGAGAGGAEGSIIERIGEVQVVAPGCVAPRCSPIHAADEIERRLRSLVGEPFDEDRAVVRVERMYAWLGYLPEISAALVEGSLVVNVFEPPRIEDVTVDPEKLVPCLPAGALEGLDPITRPDVLFREIRTRPGDIHNVDRFARDDFDLSLLGYDIVPEPCAGPETEGRRSSPRRYVITRKIPMKRWREIQGDLEGTPVEPAIEPLRLSSWDVVVGYTKRDLLTLRVFYERASLFREFDRFEISPYVSQTLAGAISYEVPWILPATVSSVNLFTGIRLYDEFTPDRLFGGTLEDGERVDAVETDERRIGGRVWTGFEPIRNLEGHTLRFTGYVNRYEVQFGVFDIPVTGVPFSRSTTVPGDTTNDLTLYGTTVEYVWEHLYRAPRVWYRLAPTFEWATKTWGGEVSFTRVRGELDQHYSFASGLEIDMRWKAGIVGREAPVFEQFTLGGDETLRGFNRDDFEGRRLFAAQNDLWIPIPFRAFNRDSELMAKLERNLKTAIIFDVGSVSFEDLFHVRLARGIGIGLRYSAERSPALVKIDVAYGYWEGHTQWYPYVAVGRRW
jgi:hypothetical protein